jgi:hypothetical protein
MMRSLYIGLLAATIAYFGLSVATAQAQLRTTNEGAQRVEDAQGPNRIVARSPDLIPIPSRIAHGVVSVRNAGAAASTPSVVTVNCHRPGQEGGCVDIPAAYLAQYTSAMYPNRLVVQVPAIQPGHVYNHTLPFWGEMAWPSGEAFQFDYVADAGGTNAESNEGNNTSSYVWNAP